MKTELDLLTETLRRLEREHTTRNETVEARLNDLATRLERWARLLSKLHTQVSVLTALLERSGERPRR